MAEVSKCQSCGAPILWAINRSTGSRIPLDARTVVYEVSYDDGQRAIATKREKETEPRYLISHFATCPNAKEHSGKNREGKR